MSKSSQQWIWWFKPYILFTAAVLMGHGTGREEIEEEQILTGLAKTYVNSNDMLS
jgi:hypothetical protein